MRYGAIDIGSNAVRLMVKEIREEAEGLRSDKVAYTRVPIRLGEDVFETGRIGPAKQKALTEAMQASVAVFHGGRGLPRMCNERHAGGGERDGGG